MRPPKPIRSPPSHAASLEAPLYPLKQAGRDTGYCHRGKLHNLEALPATGLTVSCFPVKIRAASAGWTRAVAIIDEPGA